jgi:hypothetical protein
MPVDFICSYIGRSWWNGRKMLHRQKFIVFAAFATFVASLLYPPWDDCSTFGEKDVGN